LIVTHDRDVLESVDVIYELKDKKLHEYPGNYEAYLKQNRLATSTSIHQYEIDMRSLENLKKQLVEVKRKKEKCKSTPNPFVPLYIRLQKEYARIEEQLQKPSAWIDAKSIQELKPDEKKRYEKFKTKTINLDSKHESSRGTGAMLMQCSDVQVGYGSPLFKPISFRLSRGERVRLKGRNGVGKTTLIHALVNHAEHSEGSIKLINGNMQTAQKLTFAEYKQQGDDVFNGNTLYECVEKLLYETANAVNDTVIRRTLAQYLFDPVDDASKQFDILSGGEKARLSLMRLLLQRPDVMILDEPTNHLDLPSIEELEKLLHAYDGAVLYVSHDSYFANELGGVQVELIKC
jgi:ATPase subunit of ABC transporter with duplicated ATPase domains